MSKTLAKFNPSVLSTMEDSFSARVDKVFGSLASSSSSKPQSLSSLWSLTDEEIEKREWNRGKESPEPEEENEKLFDKFDDFRSRKAIDFRAELEKDLDDLDEEDEEEEKERASLSSSKGGGKPEDYNDEEWEIKSAIGRDCTLDYEEEEDQYDKVAVGREKAGDRLYMKDANAYEVDAANSWNELPTTLKDFSRDPRANLIAAKLRLKEDAEAAKKRLEEDAEAAKKIDSLRMSDSDEPVSTLEDGNPKSILKRKDTESNPKSQKRVRFDSECKNDSSEGSEGTKDAHHRKESGSEEEEVEGMVSNNGFTLPPDYPSGIPDYMRNPSKYTKYTFDSGDVDDESNRQAYMDFLKLIKRKDATDAQADDGPIDLTKPITFIRRSKAASSDVTMAESCSESKQRQEDSDQESMQRRGLPVGIAAEDTSGDGEVCAMEEDDEPQTCTDKRNISQKSSRQYRRKPGLELDE